MEIIRLINQCNELYELGMQILSDSGWTIWLGDTDNYFEKLRNYCNYHNQFRHLLTEQCKQHQLILDRVSKLPNIHYDNFSFSRFWISILFPFSFIIKVKAITYVNLTRSKISEANTIYGSLSAMLKEIK